MFGGCCNILPLAKRVADGARAEGVEVPKSTLNWITREYERILKKALRHCDDLPDFEPARKGKRGRKKEVPRAQSRPVIAGEDGASAPIPARPFRPVANNATERALRMMKLRMKISGRFRTEQGAKDFAVMRSVVDTVRKNGLDVMEVLAGTLEQFLAAMGIEFPD